MATACLTWALMCVPGLALPQQDTDPPPSTQDDVGAGAESKPQVYTIIQGQVFDALGRGVAGSQIEIAKSDDSSVGGKVQSDSFGDFTLKLEGAHPGGFKIKITKSGFVQQVLDIQIEPEDLEPFVDVMLKGTLSIAGEVVEFLEHQPLMGAAVQLETLYRHAAAETDEGGRFEFENLIPGFAEITAAAKGFGRSKIQVQVGESPEFVRIILKPERILHLTVVDEQDRPIAGAAVEITTQPADDYRNELTDATGRASFRQLPFETEKVGVRLTHADYVATGKYDQTIMFPEDKLEIRETLHLTPAAIVKGKISDAGTGRSLNGARVDVGETPDYFAPHAFSNISGEYQVGSLAPGPVVITVHAAGYAPQLKVVTTAPRKHTVVDFELEQGRTISGLVLDKDGKPIQRVEIEAMKWRDCRTLKMSAQTDAQGRFVLDYAPPDEFKVSVYAAGKRALIDQAISSDRNDYEFTLDAAAPQEGQAGGLCRAKVGERCPPLKLKTLAGVAISDELAKGKVLLLDFWATWCAPCVAELPTLKRIHAAFAKREDLLMVSVSSDLDKTALVKFIDNQALNWHHVYGPRSGAEQLSASFGVQAIPCAILVGRDGKIIAIGLLGDGLYDAVDQALKNDKN